jgi:putative transposase
VSSLKGVREAYQLSEKTACGLMGITRWSNGYSRRKDSQAALRLRLREWPAAGFDTDRRLTVLLRRKGWAVNAKGVYRLYREEELQVRTAKRTKRARQARVPLPGAGRPNQRWSMDFVSDRFADGRWFRILMVVDRYTRECLLRSPGALTDRQKGGRATYRDHCCARRPRIHHFRQR